MPSYREQQEKDLETLLGHNIPKKDLDEILRDKPPKTLISGTKRKVERAVNDLRDYSAPPETYRKYFQRPDGTLLYMGEFPTPDPSELKYSFNNRRK